MLNFIRTVLHPERYHGYGKHPPFFEGWYFKIIDASEQQRYAVIPGVFLNADSQRQHAFIQLLDGCTGETAYVTYPLTAFQTPHDEFMVTIGPNQFSRRHMTLDLDFNGRRLHGNIDFHGLTPWPVTLTAPGIMGWYGWLPFMECYHGVISLDHTLSGTLTLNETPLSFDQGRGYIEKDWGQAFPSAWIWFQSNHFTIPGSSITGSVARIPWGNRYFRGQILGLRHQERLYRFATYTGATTEVLQLTEKTALWVLRDHRYRIEIQARRETGGLLKGPDRHEMGIRVPETLQGTLEVRLTARADGQAIFHDTGRNAGLEIAGDLTSLLNPN